MSPKAQLRVAALLMATGVAAGAFGAHALKTQVTPERLATWETAARYQLVHGLALLILARLPSPSAWPVRLITAGTLIFAGSLYLLVLTDTPALGAVTPFGGASLILGWVLLAVNPPRLD